MHRASNVARGALEDNVKRVEKIHHVSTAMFEEASYDPSLRFVLVALGLFLVFVILLVLSKVMGMESRCQFQGLDQSHGLLFAARTVNPSRRANLKLDT